MNWIAIKENVIRGCLTVEMVVVFIKHGSAVRNTQYTDDEFKYFNLFIVWYPMQTVTTTARTKRMRKIVTTPALRMCQVYQMLWLPHATTGCSDVIMNVVYRIGGNVMVCSTTRLIKQLLPNSKKKFNSKFKESTIAEIILMNLAVQMWIQTVRRRMIQQRRCRQWKNVLQMSLHAIPVCVYPNHSYVMEYVTAPMAMTKSIVPMTNCVVPVHSGKKNYFLCTRSQPLN